MSKNPTESDPDETLFRDEVRDARPLKHDRVMPWKQRRPPRPLSHLRQEPSSDLSEQYSETEIETGEELLFSRPGVQKRLLHDLRRGRLEVEWVLDLHGLTAAHAQSTLELFFRDCRRREIRCVRIIHGKGHRSEGQQPVLKRKLNLWLRQRSDVLAFCSAAPRDGGTGAVYALLRAPRKNRESN
jgi:DNA-nicking Smr family endonuclease